MSHSKRAKAKARRIRRQKAWDEAMREAFKKVADSFRNTLRKPSPFLELFK